MSTIRSNGLAYETTVPFPLIPNVLLFDLFTRSLDSNSDNNWFSFKLSTDATLYKYRMHILAALHALTLCHTLLNTTVALMGQSRGLYKHWMCCFA